jgi:hypothetical protein
VEQQLTATSMGKKPQPAILLLHASSSPRYISFNRQMHLHPCHLYHYNYTTWNATRKTISHIVKSTPTSTTLPAARGHLQCRKWRRKFRTYLSKHFPFPNANPPPNIYHLSTYKYNMYFIHFLWNVYRAFFIRLRIMTSNKCTSVCLLYTQALLHVSARRWLDSEQAGNNYNNHKGQTCHQLLYNHFTTF